MWLQLDTDLLDSPRWLNLSLPARLWYVAMLAHCIETGSGYLDRAEWEATRAMRSKLALLPEDYPDITAAGLVEELASEATHLVDLTDTEIVVRGFEKRYTEICNRRAKDAARQRDRRKKLKEVSRVTSADVTRTSKNVTGTEGDVDFDGGAALRAPAPPSRDNGKSTAGVAHGCADGNGNGDGKPKPLHWKAKDILNAWERASPDFRMWKQLRLVIQMRDDVENVLAHMIDLEESSSPVFAPAAMWKRLHPSPDRANLLPMEKSVATAKRILNADLEILAAELPAIELGASVAKGKPAAVKKRERFGDSLETGTDSVPPRPFKKKGKA